MDDNQRNVVTTRAVKAKVLIVDDSEDERWVLSNLMRQAGFTPLLAASGEEALDSIRKEAPDAMLLDVGLPGMDGFEVLEWTYTHDKTMPVIMVTANGKTHDAVRAVRAGAWDYVTKPFKNEDVILTLRCAIEEQAQKSQVREIANLTRRSDSLLQAMGNSTVIQGIQKEVERVAKTNFSILVTGESGTGKELISQAIHIQSLRGSTKPLVAVDCGAISDSLIESELFGHEKGAFTGAYQAKKGAFELADGGTIFLDEIGNLPMAMQGKLLRVLETRRVHRIGSDKELEVDFRVVAATNADLLAMVDKKTFRGDLYHRLAEYTINIPPLRERKEDLAFLVNRFLTLTNKELTKQVHGLSPSAWELVQGYHWPGNARELRNQLRRAVLVCDSPDGMMTPVHFEMLSRHASLPKSLATDTPQQCWSEIGGALVCPLRGADELLESGVGLSLTELTVQIHVLVERTILLRTLSLTNGNKAMAARLLHIDYKTIHSKLKTYEISSTQFMKDAYAHEGDEC